MSRLAALFPVFTWLSYLFIGRSQGGEAVSSQALFVLLGRLLFGCFTCLSCTIFHRIFGLTSLFYWALAFFFDNGFPFY